MAKRKSKAVAKIYGPLRIDTGGNIQVKLWDLEDPPKSYNASQCCVSAEPGEVVTHFAQSLPSGRIATAVSVGLPEGQIDNILSTFEQIRERLSDPRFSGAQIKSLSPRALSKLDSTSWIRRSAHFVRSATNNDSSVLDFYELPMVPLEVAESRPEKLEVTPVIRITMTPLLLKHWLAIAEEAHS